MNIIFLNIFKKIKRILNSDYTLFAVLLIYLILKIICVVKIFTQ